MAPQKVFSQTRANTYRLGVLLRELTGTEPDIFRCIKYAFDISAGTKEWQVVSSPFIDRFEYQRSDLIGEQTPSSPPTMTP